MTKEQTTSKVISHKDLFAQRGRIRRVLFGIFIAGGLLGTAVEGEAVTVFNNSAAYSSAVGSELFLIDFNGSPNAVVDGSTISTQATFGSPEASDPTKVLWSSNAMTDAGSTVALNGVGPVGIDFVSPVFAFSLVFSSASENETVELYDTASTLIGSVLAPNASGFFGVLSNTAIDTVIIRNGLFSPGNRDRFFIDDLRANTASVPEPLTGLLLVTGLLTITLWWRVTDVWRAKTPARSL